MSHIALHRTKGLNPRMTYCPRCGGQGQSLMLLGVHDHKGKCSKHGQVYGARITCPARGCGERLSDVKEIREHEKLPDSQPCASCLKEIEEHRAIVAAGGVYFKCDECPRTGVVKPSPFADNVRAQLNIKAPSECGVQFEHCSEHDPKEPTQ